MFALKIYVIEFCLFPKITGYRYLHINNTIHNLVLLYWKQPGKKILKTFF